MLVILFILAALFGALMLAISISRLFRLVRDSVFLRSPLLAEQTLEFDKPGSLLLNTEAPLLASAFQVPPAFRGLEYTLRHAESGTEVPLHRVLAKVATSSFRKTRIPIRRFQLDRPAKLTLTIGNLAPEVKTDDCALVFTRPYGAAMPLLILMIVAGALLFIGGTVFTILWLSGAF